MRDSVEFEVTGRNLAELEDAAARMVAEFTGESSRGVDYILDVSPYVSTYQADVVLWKASVRGFISERSV